MFWAFIGRICNGLGHLIGFRGVLQPPYLIGVINLFLSFAWALSECGRPLSARAMFLESEM